MLGINPENREVPRSQALGVKLTGERIHELVRSHERNWGKTKSPEKTNQKRKSEQKKKEEETSNRHDPVQSQLVSNIPYIRHAGLKCRLSMKKDSKTRED